VKLKLTIEGGEGRCDALVVADTTATVGALIERICHRLYGAVPPPGAAPTGLVVNRGSAGQRTVDGSVTLGEAGLRSGDVVSLTSIPGDSTSSPPVGVLHVVSGPDAPSQFPLHRGTNYLGRDRGAQIRLSDPLVSKRHAKVNVTDAVEVIDERVRQRHRDRWCGRGPRAPAPRHARHGR
jgi:S-DNA-T family DNA segregation ATPase FtsK/SpoIIIE